MSNTLWIYVAAASTEIPRVKNFLKLIEDHNLTNPEQPIEVTGKWWDVIEARGEANPASEFTERMKYAADDLKNLRDASVLVLLMPEPNNTTIGAYWEAGYADALGLEILIVGENLERSIFTTRGCCFHSPDTAADYLADIAHAQWCTERYGAVGTDGVC